MTLLGDIQTRVDRWLWGQDLRQASALRQRTLRGLQLGYALGRDLLEGQLTLRAMSLVYTTLLSLVPLLALSFSVLKAFGVHNQIRPTLLTLLEPLGPKGAEITTQVIGFVENTKVGVLGALGLAMLVYTVVSLLQKIESAFNHVWHVQRPRRLAERFSQYLSVLTIGPLLVFAALGITATLSSQRVVQALAGFAPLGAIVGGIGRLVPYLLVIAAFAFVYRYMPNTKVRLRAALIGAVVAGVLWQSVGWGFAAFVAGSAKYTAVYAGFAIVVLSMIWLYLSWLIVLLGASLAFYVQHPEYLATFVRRGILAETAAEPPAYVPARAPDTVRVKEVLDMLRTAEEPAPLAPGAWPREPQVEALLARIDDAIAAALREVTLRDLLREEPAGAPAARERVFV